VGDWNPDEGFYVFATGKKGSGKSHASRQIWDSYPYDRLVIDPTGDVQADLRREGVPFTEWKTGELPKRFPKGEHGQPVTVVFSPDAGSESLARDMDDALGIALRRGRVGVWIDEIGIMTRGNSTPPNLRRVLHHGRHSKMTMIMAGPRPIDIDPLVVAQSDHVLTFHLPNPNDRRRVADAIGWNPRTFDGAVAGLGTREFLWYNAHGDDGRGTLTHSPPLPPRAAARRLNFVRSTLWCRVLALDRRSAVAFLACARPGWRGRQVPVPRELAQP
jgi:hypothetical protein